jgi:hypothetical protein
VPRGLVAAAALLALRAGCAGADLEIGFSAIGKALALQVFTQDGRKYVRGDGKQRCNFAYLEHPQISGAGGRLGIRARFTGRSARNFFGRCVGLGDSFDLQIFATPYFHDGVIGLREVRVESINKDGVYVRMVRAALANSLATDFQYRVAEDAKRILEAPSRDALPLRQELRNFNVRGIRVTSDAVVLSLDFTLSVQ